MLYLVIALAGFILFMLRPFFGYYEYRRKYEEIRKELWSERERFSKSEKQYEEKLKNARSAKQAIEKDSAAKEAKMQEKISALGQELSHLKHNYIPYDPFLDIDKATDKTVSRIDPAHRHAPSLSPEEQRRLREKTWGELYRVHRHVYGTLTPEQEKLVNYPAMDASEVFFAPNSKSFHAVDWCYTIEASAEIGFCSLAEAKSRKLKPCSKCVGPEYR